MSTLIRAIRIKLDKAYTAVPDMGLYTEDGVSQLRYSESPLTGVSTTYKNGILIESGDIECNADFRKGGASVQVSDITIKLAGTIILGGAQRQFCYALDMAGISLIGLILEIIEFEGTEEDSDSVEVLTMFTGSIENISWNETEFTITVKSSLSLKRNACMTITNSNGIVTPITFGSSDPASGRYFKMVRSNDTIKKLKVSDFASGGVSGTNYLPPELSIFNIYQKTDDKKYSVRIGYFDGTSFPTGRESYFIGKWVQCVEGEPENVGQWRKIISANRLTLGQVEVELEFDSYWPKDLIGSYDGTVANQTWLEFYELENEYVIDNAQCNGFFDVNNNELDNDVEVYSKNNEDVSRVANYGYISDVTNTNKNTLIINPLVIDGAPNKLKSFLMLPVTSVSRYGASNLSAWYIDGDNPFEFYTNLEDGIFSGGGVPPGHQVSDVVFTGATSVGDKNHSTLCEFNFLNRYASYFYVALSFTLPELPKGFKFDKAYLCAKIESKSGYGAGTHEIRIRGYIDRVKKVLTGKVLKDFNTSNWGQIDSLPDFYYKSTIETGNKNFYKNAPEVSGSYPLISGYKNFELPNITHENYVNIIEAAILFMRNYSTETTTDYTKVYEIAVMLEKEFDIKDVIYV